ncbi:Efflux pump membrane transporter BepE [Gimesia panareensis]|uniref:Efflux pump membrane transporter BepE n=1 Tax=Gimesia panareensis TaxID=2527978 RepID=A0A518FRQ7_9PLAN|nr:efflux RND transporter permease subunit [Gimesia panareensis]QDV19023.1 Efflux pump membrane transporter BepE [Gimesia panareensis]
MNLITAIVHNPVKVTVGVLLTVLFGLVALTRMPMQLTPEVQRPTITVETRWPGASPQEVEREIVLEQEEQLKSVEGITKLSSESADSKGTITLEFLVGTNMDEALLKVNSRLQQVPEYPEDADQPIISTANAADRPIAWFILSSRLPDKEKILAFGEKHPELKERLEVISKTPNPGLAMLRLRLLSDEYPDVRGEILPKVDIEVTKLRRFAEDEIEARFERVAGVSQSNVLGGLEEELQVVVDSEQLAARQLTIADVRRVLRGQNADTSAGDFWEGKRRWVVRTLGQFRNIEEVEDQLLAIRDGAPVYVRDVAEVRLGYKKPDGLVRRFGESSIAVNCIRETGANVLEIMNGLRDAAQDIDETVLKPRGLQLVQVYDETDYIYSSVDLVKNNIFIGGALTMIVLMSFLHLGIRTLIVVPFIILTAIAAAYISPWFFAVCLALIVGAGFWFARGALVVGLAIPTSIIGTFLILGLMGRSLNVISLAGLAFAVGMLVDNAVVVLENIFRRYSLGESPFRAAIKGTQEVWGAVLASTLTTIAVFLPVVFIQEEAGQLFQDIALAISAAVGLSLLVSMTLISTASARLLHKREGQDIEDMRVVDNPEPEEPQHKGALHRLIIGPIESGGALFVKTVVGMNHWIQQGLLRRLVVTAVLVGAAFGISWQLWPKVEYLPTGNRNLIFCILLPPPGYNLNQLMELGETVESDLRPYWDIVDPGSDEAKKLDYPVIGDFFFVARGRMVFMGIRAYDSQRVGELIPLVQRAGMKLPGTFAVAKQSSLFEQGLTGGRTVEVEIIGPDLKKLVGMGGQVLVQVKGMIPDAQVRPIPSLDLSSPEVHIEPKLVQAADMGVSSADLGYMVNALVDGAYAGDYYLGGDKIDLSIVGESRHIQNTQDVQALSVATPIGNLVSLDALAKVEITSGPEQVNHRERQRAITIEVSPPEAMALEDAMQQIQDKIVQPMREGGQLAGGYRIMLSGTADKLRDTWAALQFNVLLALMITYLLMAALFESWLYPFVIIFSVPLGAVGGILGLSILNLFMLQTLDVLTMLGFVILIGTVVNNPILIIHQSLNHINEDGMTPREAILESIRTRIRPIFMTTTTTVLGLLPLVLFPGAGSELYRGLGSVVLGGLIVSTLFTLVLVPTLFSLTMDAKQSVVNLLRPGVVSQLKAKAATASDVDSQEKENVSV